MKKVRRFHLYLGMLFSPAIIFFAFTGALQTLGLHEARQDPGGSAYKWIVTAAEIHKNQRLKKPSKSATSSFDKITANKSAGISSGGGRTQTIYRVSLLKWFVLMMACGLITTAFLGIYLAFRYTNNRRVLLLVLIAGVALPLCLLILGDH